jgi:hypothetical protein
VIGQLAFSSRVVGVGVDGRGKLRLDLPFVGWVRPYCLVSAEERENGSGRSGHKWNFF